ncbi:MAG: cyclic nucleotide-binding domain-containing protein [Actinomycetota bacterium]|nr:cyclic nucleotide-binding domain-containing protein [Actinomycetota bacterium]
MRVESSVTSLSWIPSESLPGLMKLPFELGVAHYDKPPDDVLADLDALRRDDRFRFANELRAWVEVDGGRIIGHGYAGRGHIGATTLRLGSKAMTFAAVALPDLQREPEIGAGWVRFVQTTGGRTGAPAPRRVTRPPYVQITAPTAWTTLALTIHSDGRSEHELVGASPFPRHWVYDDAGRLASKSGLIDAKTWSQQSFGDLSPWGAHDSPVLVSAVESALERELAGTIMGGRAPSIRRIVAGEVLVEQGTTGTELFLVLDGVLTVEVDGEQIAEVGPGAILGERAILETGKRTSTLRALTACKVAVAAADQVDRVALAELATGHRREVD